MHSDLWFSVEWTLRRCAHTTRVCIHLVSLVNMFQFANCHVFLSWKLNLRFSCSHVLSESQCKACRIHGHIPHWSQLIDYRIRFLVIWLDGISAFSSLKCHDIIGWAREGHPTCEKATFRELSPTWSNSGKEMKMKVQSSSIISHCIVV